ncbi:MAG TPA: Gfo/Idh/MocA family oxidoreductase [Chitinophagaceae bacterium]|nr:Gfo/Idh/MocA family oxidoreductase [Chitinophagaceae bacterium]
MKPRFFLSLLFILAMIAAIGQQAKPLRVGIAGLTHDHVHGLLSRAKDGDIEIVGIAEPNRELAERYLKRYNLPLTLIYSSLGEMLDKCKPEAVCAFNSISEHLEVVKACAPRKINVMVEKPLAVSLADAEQMQTLALKYGIQLLTNYETTWYGSNHLAFEMLDSIGDIRKVVVHDGHQGPKEIGVSKEFLDWLTDPVKNGGGAVMDFGCYGANLLTWLMHGERPLAVFAVTQQIKPEIYPKVDDEATIVVTYPKAQGIIQASWNWPFGRKDIEIYGTHGYMIADHDGLKTKTSAEKKEAYQAVPRPKPPYHDPFAYFAAVTHGLVTVKPTDLSSLQNNMIVMEILDAAKRSAKEGKMIYLKK